MARLRAVTIIVTFLAFTFVLMPVQWLLLKLKSRYARTFPHWYHRRVAQIFGFHVHVVGTPVTGEGVLMIANHTSWADIIVFSAAAPISFVAKAEVATWPFFGTLARLQRDDLASRLLAIGRRTASRMKPETKRLDHGELLYDEQGLPG